jgi:GNAT superfamily N-acetyltransferase
VNEVGPDAVPALEAAMGVQHHLVALRLARGSRCFAAWLGEEMTGYGWLSTGSEWIGELSLDIRPPPGEAYVWSCVTLPAHRRQGVFRALLLGVATIAGREGIARLWLGSVDGVAESAVVGAGFLPVLDFRVATLGPLGWLDLRPVEGADRATVSAARDALGAGRGLRLHRRRQH